MVPRRWLLMLASGLLACSVSGCFTIYKSFDVPAQHVVMFDSDGSAVNPAGNLWPGGHTDLLSYDKMKREEYREHIKTVIHAIKEAPLTDGKRKVLLFIHGGLNTQVGSLERVRDEVDGLPRYEQIKAAGYFPIFINWKSSLFSSYFEHLFLVRQGERRPFLGPATFPFVLASDLGRSVIRAPLVWGMLVMNDVQTLPALYEPSHPDAVAVELLCRYRNKEDVGGCTDRLTFRNPPLCLPFGRHAVDGHRPPGTGSEEHTSPIAVGEDERACPEMVARFTSFWLTLPAKLVTAPILDAFGTSAWNNMLRRVHLLFHSEDELRQSRLTERATERVGLSTLKASGGLSRFARKLAQAVQEDRDAGIEWELVIVGHSMGTIVANELIRNFGNDLSISDIVYLAAATTVRDYEDTMFPYLTRHVGSARLHHLVLHRQAEAGEIPLEQLDLTPRGSLLVWIDNFLANPLTILDRTAGSYNNLLTSVHDTPQDIRSSVSIRAFSAGRARHTDNPLGHSEMAERLRFWKRECWMPDTAPAPCMVP